MKKSLPAPLFDLEPEGNKVARVLSGLKHDGVKECSITTHSTGGAEPGDRFAENHRTGVDYLAPSVFSVPSVFLALPSLSVPLDESELWEESSVPQWPQ